MVTGPQVSEQQFNFDILVSASQSTPLKQRIKMKTDLIATTWTCKNTDHRIEVASINNDGSLSFAVRNHWRECLNKDGRWEDELSPSNRTTAFLKRCRFDDFEAAAKALEQAL